MKWRVIGILCVTQILGWGTTYYLPTALSRHFQEDLNLSNATAFLGVSLMLAVSAVAAPRAALLIERFGAQPIMAAGSMLTAVGLFVLALATYRSGYFIAWCILGFAFPLALTQAASSAAAQVLSVEQADRAIALVMMAVGFAPAIFWPLSGWLADGFGWRAVCLVYAFIHLLLCGPLHAILPNTGKTIGKSTACRASKRTVGPRGLAFWLLAIALTLPGVVTSGLLLHLPKVLGLAGQDFAASMASASFVGCGQVAGRLLQFIVQRFLKPIWIALLGLEFIMVSVLTYILGGSNTLGSLAFLFMFGFGSGIFSVTKMTLPLHLFGKGSYSKALGRLSMLQNGVLAASPFFFSEIIGTFGTSMLLAGIISLLLIAAVVLLFFLYAVSDVGNE